MGGCQRVSCLGPDPDGSLPQGRLRVMVDQIWGVLDTRGTVGAAISMIVYLVVSVLAPLGAA